MLHPVIGMSGRLCAVGALDRHRRGAVRDPSTPSPEHDSAVEAHGAPGRRRRALSDRSDCEGLVNADPDLLGRVPEESASPQSGPSLGPVSPQKVRRNFETDQR